MLYKSFLQSTIKFVHQILPHFNIKFVDVKFASKMNMK